MLKKQSFFVAGILLFFFTKLYSQPPVTCNGALGLPIINITFGGGVNNSTVGLPAGTTNYVFVNAGTPAANIIFDGQYSLIQDVPPNPSWWGGGRDHTGNGFGNGYMAFFNAAQNAGIFYQQTVNGLCPGTTYQFSAWIANVVRAASGLTNRPNVTMQILDPNTSAVLGTINTGNIANPTAMTWLQYGMLFITPPGVNSVSLVLTNNNVGGNGAPGNDLAIDDITFSPCGPITNASFSPDAVQVTQTICSGASVNLFGTVGGGLNNPTSQWQISSDNGINWTDLPGATTLNYTIPTLGAGVYLIRLLSAEAGNINTATCRFISNILTLTVNNCCSDTCYWKVTGNNIIGGNNILGTLTNDDIRLYSNNTQRGLISANGFFGWNTTPNTLFHIDCANPGEAPSNLRFENLTKGEGSQLLVDKNGYVFFGREPGGGGLINNCGALNYLTKTGNPGLLECSQVYDDGNFVGIATTSPFFVNGTQSRLYVNGLTVSNSFYAISDGKYKKNVTTIPDAMSIINRLRGVTYTWDKESYPSKGFENDTQAGFIAQEVNKVFPVAVGIDKEDNYVLNYNAFIPLLTKGQQELQALIIGLTEKNNLLQKQVEDLENKLLLINSNRLVESKFNAENILYQNKPNPFDGTTTIEYQVARYKNSAFVIIYDLTGKEISKIQLAGYGKGNVKINANTFTNGIYLYSLIIDGVEADTKKMVVLKN